MDENTHLQLSEILWVLTTLYFIFILDVVYLNPAVLSTQWQQYCAIAEFYKKNNPQY